MTVLEIVRSESPHVHGAQRLAVHYHSFALAVFGIHFPVCLLFDIVVFLHMREIVFAVRSAETSGNTAGFRKGIVEFESYEAIFTFGVFMGTQPVCKYSE